MCVLPAGLKEDLTSRRETELKHLSPSGTSLPEAKAKRSLRSLSLSLSLSLSHTHTHTHTHTQTHARIFTLDQTVTSQPLPQDRVSHSFPSKCKTLEIGRAH